MPGRLLQVKKLKVSFRPSAVRDLDAIYDWVLGASANRVVATRYISRIVAKCRKLGDMPYGGRARNDIRPGLRTFPFEKTAIIVYRVTDSVEIMKIYFAGQNFEALLRDRPADLDTDEN
jgi:toxin ParE1/3/4